LLFGPAGLLLMLAVQEWPARITCPDCRKPRAVTRDTCEHCGSPHASPAPDGTEIFEAKTATPHEILPSSRLV
jgi:predicted amidophosphoribosyltransferase